jgi:hypothetical protein
MTNDELREVNQLEQDIRSLTDDMLVELKSLSAHAMRGDSLAVASVAYRVRQFALRNQMPCIEKTAARIEDSARRNNVNQFTSDIQLLDHQLRWHTQSSRS